MSIQSISSRVKALQSDLDALQRQLAAESRKQAANSGRIVSIRRSITKHTSPSTVAGKMRDIERLESENSRLQDKIASVNKRISEKTTELHKRQQELAAEQEREQGKVYEELRRIKAQESERASESLSQVRALVGASPVPTVVSQSPSQQSYHAFISHASEDKEDIVRPLAEALRELGYSIWYDEFELEVGDSLRRKIDQGLAHSRFGIVVLSPAFFAKNWPQYELDGLVAKEMQGSKVVLPIWHRVSKDDVLRYSPPLADRLALSTSTYTISELAAKLAEALGGA